MPFCREAQPPGPTARLVETRLWAQCAAHRGLGEGHGRGGHGVRHSPATHSLGVSPVSSEARVGAFTCAHLHRFPTAGHRAGMVRHGHTGPCRSHSGPSASRSHLRALTPRLLTAKSGAPLRPCVISERPWGLLWARGGEGVGCGLSQGAGPLGQRVPQGTSQRGMAGAQLREVLSCGPPAGCPAARRPRSIPPHHPPSTIHHRQFPGRPAGGAQHGPLCLARPRFSRARQAARLRPPGDCLGWLFRPG